ncbi:YnbE family lipoprotein [Pasteurellaceae bacterium RH1A]|nr:YnbE family lipoprotein [Pasteurellaceae bacterium RH1A]
MMKPVCFAIFCLVLTACTPKVQLETPKEGITINMNVVVDHKIEVKMDKESRAVIGRVIEQE